MALEYKLEFVYDEGDPSDDSVYIQLRKNPPIYRSHTDKEDYDVLPEEEKHPFLTGIFNIAGVTEVSSRAYRVWIMKSPVYSWEEVLAPVLNFIKNWYSESSFSQLPGSADPNGVGMRIYTVTQRRDR